MHILSGLPQNHQLNHPFPAVLGVAGQDGAGEIVPREANGNNGGSRMIGGRIATRKDRPDSQKKGQAK